MKKSAKEAMKEILEQLKTSEVDNDNLLKGHRIDQYTDMIQNHNTILVLNEEVMSKILSFSNANNESNYREFGTYFYGKNIDNIIYISGYTGTDFEEADGLYEKGAVEVTQRILQEMDILTSKIENPYNVVVHFHTHPDHIKNKQGEIIVPSFKLYSENDLYSYAYHQVYMQPENNPVVYIGGMSCNNNGSPRINFVFYDIEEQAFCNINNIYYLEKDNLCKIENFSLLDTKVMDDDETSKINKRIRIITDKQ